MEKMNKFFMLFACLICCCLTLNFKHNNQVVFPTGKVSLQADNGRYLARCYECIELSGKVGALVVKDDSINPASTWSAIKIGGKVAFQSDNGRYISRCLNCFNNSKIPNSAVIISRTPSITTAKFTPFLLQNGKWALQADNGVFLARCSSCVSGNNNDFAFIYVDDLQNPLAQWKVTNI